MCRRPHRRPPRLAGLVLAAVALFAASASPAASAESRVWQPAPGTTWQWQITGRVDESLNVQMYDVDLEDAVPTTRTVQVPGFGSAVWRTGVNAGIVERLHARGIVVVCYLDSGAWESYRPDARLFPKGVIGNSSGWKGEFWLDIRPRSWHRFAPIIWARLGLAKDIGCEAVEPDENNPWGNHPGFPITLADEKAWYLEVASQGHAAGLSVGMKNGVEVVDADTVAAFDWSLNKECFQYRECGTEEPFVLAGKAVFQVEYRGDPDRFCPKARARGFSTLKKHLNLGAWRISC